jgi:hypothetical protein
MIEQQPPTSRYPSVNDHASAGSDPRMLLASIVHDFNSFLTPIVNIMQELQRPKTGTRKQLSAIFCAFRAKVLARQLLDFPNSCQIQLVAVDRRRLRCGGGRRRARFDPDSPRAGPGLRVARPERTER